mmetsp:Transcript_3677/g.10098  ORF Transcript_3677/g.10098 Transcript_3677/m.10098 type:complete len:216 (+) Transcript_3677:697-1344(+)
MGRSAAAAALPCSAPRGPGLVASPVLGRVGRAGRAGRGRLRNRAATGKAPTGLEAGAPIAGTRAAARALTPTPVVAPETLRVAPVAAVAAVVAKVPRATTTAATLVPGAVMLDVRSADQEPAVALSLLEARLLLGEGRFHDFQDVAVVELDPMLHLQLLEHHLHVDPAVVIGKPLVGCLISQQQRHVVGGRHERLGQAASVAVVPARDMRLPARA